MHRSVVAPALPEAHGVRLPRRAPALRPPVRATRLGLGAPTERPPSAVVAPLENPAGDPDRHGLRAGTYGPATPTALGARVSREGSFVSGRGSQGDYSLFPDGDGRIAIRLLTGPGSAQYKIADVSHRTPADYCASTSSWPGTAHFGIYATQPLPLGPSIRPDPLYSVQEPVRPWGDLRGAGAEGPLHLDPPRRRPFAWPIGADLTQMFGDLLGSAGGYCPRPRAGSMLISPTRATARPAHASGGGLGGLATGAALSARVGAEPGYGVFFGGALGRGA